MNANRRIFYYNYEDDVWQESKCNENNVEYRLKRLNVYDNDYSTVYLPMIWSVELRENRIVELILYTKALTIENGSISNTQYKEWTIDCDFDNHIMQGWPVSLIRNTKRNWRNGYVCGANIAFPELLATTYVDIPVTVIDVAIEYLRDVAKDRFGFRPSYLGNAHGLNNLIAFFESPLDPNLYMLKDVIGEKNYTNMLRSGCFDTYRELCKLFGIEKPPSSLRKAYVMKPENLVIYIFLRNCGFADINIIRRFFYREEIFGYPLLKLHYDDITGQITQNSHSGYAISYFQRFCRWLLSHRSEKAIASRILRWSNEKFSHAAIDTLRMFIAAELYENEELINITIVQRLINEGLTQEVHDALFEDLYIIRPDIADPFHNRKKLEYKNTTYSYNDKEISLETTIDGYDFFLPKDTKELQKWSNKFHNCVACYDSMIINGNSLIVAMQKEDKYVACIEIQQRKITQALGVCNTNLSKEYKFIINIWAKLNNILYVYK